MNYSGQKTQVRIRNAILTEGLGYTALWRISCLLDPDDIGEATICIHLSVAPSRSVAWSDRPTVYRFYYFFDTLEWRCSDWNLAFTTAFHIIFRPFLVFLSVTAIENQGLLSIVNNWL